LAVFGEKPKAFFFFWKGMGKKRRLSFSSGSVWGKAASLLFLLVVRGELPKQKKISL